MRPGAVGARPRGRGGHRPRGGRVERGRPEVKSKRAAEEVEIEVGEPVLSLAGDVARDAVRAGKLRGEVVDDDSFLIHQSPAGDVRSAVAERI